MTDREAMKQALEALEGIQWPGSPSFVKAAITALRERLAQPEQEQNSTCNNTLRAEGKGYPRTCRKCGKGPCIADRVQPEQEPVCAHGIGKTKCSFCHQPQPQPEQEPVAHTLNCVCGAVWDVSPDGVEEMVHAPNPPQRKPLTDEEISNIWCKVSNTDFVTADTHEFARAIEAAHGIKGEA